MTHTTPSPVRRASQGRSGCAHTTARELSGVLHNHFCTTKAAGRPLAKPAAEWSNLTIALYGAGAFLLGIAVVGGFH